MGQVGSSSATKTEEEDKGEYTMMVASSYGGSSYKQYNLQKLYIPSFEKSQVYSIPYHYADSPHFLDIGSSLVIAGNENLQLRSSKFMVSFLHRSSLSCKARHEFSSNGIGGRILYDVGYDRVVVKFDNAVPRVVSPDSVVALTNFPGVTHFDVVAIDKNTLLIATATDLKAYNIEEHTVQDVCSYPTISSFVLIKVFSSLYCLFDFYQKKSWSILANSVRGSVRASMYPLNTQEVRKFLQNSINFRSVKRVADTYYFFAISGVVYELDVRSIAGLYIKMHTVWGLGDMRRRGTGLGRVNSQCWRIVCRYL